MTSAKVLKILYVIFLLPPLAIAIAGAEVYMILWIPWALISASTGNPNGEVDRFFLWAWLMFTGLLVGGLVIFAAAHPKETMKQLREIVTERWSQSS